MPAARRALIFAVAAVLVAGGAVSSGARAQQPHAAPDLPDVASDRAREALSRRACTDRDDSAYRFGLPVGGERAEGFFALPPRRPRGIVVFSHGYGHSSYSWQHHLKRVSEALGVVTIAMDYRGLTVLDAEKAPGIPETRGWPVRAGAEDGIAATQLFASLCPSARTIVNYGVSMGGNTAGLMAAARATRADGSPLFDYWFDIEGATNVAETYLSARALVPTGNATAVAAVEDIEAEMGGPVTDPSAAPRYQEESVVTRSADIKASGVKGVVLVHGVDDGLVSHDISHQMRAALAAVDVPTQFFVVTLRDAKSERETTATGYAAGPVTAALQDASGAGGEPYMSPLTGHASEMSTTHLVSVTGFDRLAALFGGQAPTCTRQYVVDGVLGTYPSPSPC